MVRNDMIRKVTIISCGIFCSFVANSQEDPNVAQMKRLYSKMSEVLTVGNNVIRPNGSFLLLASPGYLLDPTLQPDSNVQDRVLLNALIEKTVEPDWIYRPKSELSSEIYRRILTYHQAPEFKLLPEQKAKLDSYNGEIYRKAANGTAEYTIGWSQYLDTRNQYAIALDNSQTWMNLNPGKLLPAVLSNAQKQAKENYFNLGDGARRSVVYQRKREIEAFDPESWWAELTGFFDNNVDEVGGRPYPRNLYYPKYSNWIKKTGSWTKVSFNQKDFDQTTVNGSTSSGGGLGFSYGLFSVGGSGSGSSDWNKLDTNVSNISVSFEVLRVNIERPWMDTMVFYSNAWRWGCGAIDQPLLSDGGDPSKGQQLTGLMPLLPTGILIARNLNISMAVSQDVRDTINKQSSGGGGVSFGPFRLGGRTSSSSSSTHVKATATGTGVSFDAPQIIGFFTEVLPRTPNPLPSLVFEKCGVVGPPAAGIAASLPADKDSVERVVRHLNKIGVRVLK